MAIVINGSGTVTGLAVGGLPDGTVDAGTLASGIDKTSITDGGNATAITIDSAENVGIGVAPSSTFTLKNGANLTYAGPIGYFDTNSAYSSSADRYVINGAATRLSFINGVQSFQVAASGSAGGAITFTTAMTIDNSGNTYFGGTSLVDGTAEIRGAGASAGKMAIRRSSGTNKSMISFLNGSNAVGDINTNTSSTAYNTSSDYRLKENVDYTWDATTRLKQLKPARFNFIADDTTTVDGFLAHEAQAVVPECVTGTKDAMMDETDEEGNVTSVPDMQGIDQSKLVPLLVKTIQELEARITALEA